MKVPQEILEYLAATPARVYEYYKQELADVQRLLVDEDDVDRLRIFQGMARSLRDRIKVIDAGRAQK